MRPQNIIYVAIHKDTGRVLSGAKFQTAMTDKTSLARSIGQTGVKRDKYDIYKVNLDTMAKELAQ